MHVDLVVIPQGHDKNHTLVQGIAHGLHLLAASPARLQSSWIRVAYLHAALLAKMVGVSEHALLCLAEAVCDRASADTSDVGVGLLEDLSSLNVESANLGEVTVGGVVRRDELGL